MDWQKDGQIHAPQSGMFAKFMGFPLEDCRWQDFRELEALLVAQLQGTRRKKTGRPLVAAAKWILNSKHLEIQIITWR